MDANIKFMEYNLLDIPTKDLLEKIGAGNHKPGSGSAAALNGILSCKLLLTVIELTIDPKRSKLYSHCKEEFKSIQENITDQIGGRLEILFQEDSVQFDKAINKRKERDKENNQSDKNNLHEESLIELKKSTELPIEIAELSIQLANYAKTVFLKGFKSARGDSGVAFSSALSSITGCLSIISLNLQSFPKSLWTDKIKIKRQKLRKEFDGLNQYNFELMGILDEEADKKNDFLAEFQEIRKMYYGKNTLTFSDIENLARRIQNSLWKYHDLIWPNQPPNNALGVIKPEKVIRLLKYAFKNVQTLGVNNYNEEIAGVIDNKKSTIYVSNQHSQEVVNFTTAHELGHALLHDLMILHRDIPTDGSEFKRNRSLIEKQADKFAAYFLMPEKTLRELFKRFFQTQRFQLSEETSVMLANCSMLEFQKKVNSKRDLSRILANCEFYNYSPFNSLSKIFNVSIEAMAIRLEELHLIDY
jgi:Zn-dependent peptidase ImmA (M78 family)/formiminotetrahydrofolate cyclodeaminase